MLNKREVSTTMPSDNLVASELDFGELPEELIEFARKEWGEDPDTRCQVLEEFKDYIYEQGECTPHRMDDGFLIRFLRARKFVIVNAHRLLVNYCEFRESNPEFFDNVDLMLLKKVGDHDLITVPPYREQTGRRVMQFKLGLWDPEVFTIEEVFQATLLILELAIAEPRAQVLGGICFFDLAGLTMQQLWYFTPSVARKMFEILVTSFPYKVHALHVVNQPWIFEIAFNIFKPFINERMRERIFIHSDNMESLHQHIDPKYLAERYGGIHPEYNYYDWIEFFKRDKHARKELAANNYTVSEDETCNVKNGKADS